VLGLDTPAVTLWPSQKPRRRLNWQNRRERLLAFNSLCQDLVPTATRAQAETLVLNQTNKPRLAVAVGVLTVAAKAWLWDVVVVLRLVAEVTSSFLDLRRQTTRTTMLRLRREHREHKEHKEHKAPKALRRISSAVAVKATGGLDLETLMATGDNPVPNHSLHRITPKLRIWATST